jgi:hypothetical protein
MQSLPENDPHGPLEALRAHLSSLSSGPVQDVSTFENLLADVWDRLPGSGAQGMKSSKLLGRVENPVWQSPFLKFQIERHGGTVMGSTRAELQTWCIDIEGGNVECVTTGRRQLYRLSKSFKEKDAAELAKEIAEKIFNKKKDSRLKWSGLNRVQVIIGEAVPSGGGKQTEAARRRRFAPYLRREMEKLGWRELPSPPYYVFKRSTATAVGR